MLDQLRKSDRAAVARIAAERGASPDVVMVEIVTAYLALARAVPDALPDDPLRRLTSSAIRRGV